MKFLFFDTETTGLPKKRIDALVEPGNYPDIVSIAWIVVTDAGVVVRSNYHVISPDGWTIPEDSIRIHKITNEIARQGIPLQKAMTLFLEDVSECEVVVAHNLDFDRNVVNNALHWRLKMNVLSPSTQQFYCTMQEGAKLMKVPSSHPKFYRPPKLSVLYTFLFNEEPSEVLHNALGDTMICMKVYFAMQDLRVGREKTVTNGTLPPIATTKLSLCLADSSESV
jgi:DNA polymerase III epsilon subunit-like protein